LISTITVGNADDLGIAPEAVCRFYGDNWKRRIALELPSFYRWQFMELSIVGSGTRRPGEDKGEDHIASEGAP
jgi:hypothetical protein